MKDVYIGIDSLAKSYNSDKIYDLVTTVVDFNPGWGYLDWITLNLIYTFSILEVGSSHFKNCTPNKTIIIFTHTLGLNRIKCDTTLINPTQITSGSSPQHYLSLLYRSDTFW